MGRQLNRDMWNHFLQQMDAQVDGDFLALAAEYEAIMGHPFRVGSSPQAMFDMLHQAMNSQSKRLLTSAVQFIALLPIPLQAEFRMYSCHHLRDVDSNKDQKKYKKHPYQKSPIAGRLWDFLHLNRAV